MEKVCKIHVCSFFYSIYDNSVLAHIVTTLFIYSNINKICYINYLLGMLRSILPMYLYASIGLDQFDSYMFFTDLFHMGPLTQMPKKWMPAGS